jgi:Fic family protein
MSLDRNAQRAGRFITQGAGTPGEYRAFEPAPLPPEPPLDLTGPIQDALATAHLALGRLDGGSLLLPGTDLFLYMYVRKEAVLSSQIEGTQSSLSDLLVYETAGAVTPVGDVEEVSHYVRAMNHGVRRLKELPISTRLLREVHGELLRGGRGADRTPGELRTSQNWIGGSRPGNAAFVPPAPHRIGAHLSNLENFLHDETVHLPAIVKAGLAHAQFETIHPFLDGNGRVGRLLITLILLAEGVLHAPLLYVSLFFKEHRAEYYERLQRVRTHGEWEEWMLFYLDAVATVAAQATATAAALTRMFDEHHATIAKAAAKSASSALRVYGLIKTHAALTIPEAAKVLELTQPTVSNAVKLLEGLGILSEVTGKQRDRVFVYTEYMKILSDGPPEHRA